MDRSSPTQVPAAPGRNLTFLNEDVIKGIGRSAGQRRKYPGHERRTRGWATVLEQMSTLCIDLLVDIGKAERADGTTQSSSYASGNVILLDLQRTGFQHNQ